MSYPNDFGPSSERVIEFIESWSTVEWFGAIETPHPKDPDILRVPLETLLDDSLKRIQGNSCKDPWQGLLGRAEAAFESVIFENARLGTQDAVKRALDDPIDIEYLMDLLVDRYPGYYKDSHMYAYELVDPPLRLVRGAAQEIMISDLEPDLQFFRDLMPWLQEGYWPYGWEGLWPGGTVMVI